MKRNIAITMTLEAPGDVDVGKRMEDWFTHFDIRRALSHIVDIKGPVVVRETDPLREPDIFLSHLIAQVASTKETSDEESYVKTFLVRELITLQDKIRM